MLASRVIIGDDVDVSAFFHDCCHMTQTFLTLPLTQLLSFCTTVCFVFSKTNFYKLSNDLHHTRHKFIHLFKERVHPKENYQHLFIFCRITPVLYSSKHKIRSEFSNLIFHTAHVECDLY